MDGGAMPKQTDDRRDGISIEDRWKAKGRPEGRRWLAKVRGPADARLHPPSLRAVG